jgi:hypothetical protein
VLLAALIAQEADRLGVLPGQVGDVVVPEPEPSTVVIAGFRLSLEAGAQIAALADAEGLTPKKLIEKVVTEHAEALHRRARARPRGRRH